jgi:hypothetical protein
MYYTILYLMPIVLKILGIISVSWAIVLLWPLAFILLSLISWIIILYFVYKFFDAQ